MRLIATVDIIAAVTNTTAAEAMRSVGSYNTSGCGSHVPGKVPGTYEVKISRKLLSQFKSAEYDLTYYIALEPDITWEG